MEIKSDSFSFSFGWKTTSTRSFDAGNNVRRQDGRKKVYQTRDGSECEEENRMNLESKWHLMRDKLKSEVPRS